MTEIKKENVKVDMIVYWVLLGIGVILAIIGFSLNILPLGIVGAVIPGIFGLLRAWLTLWNSDTGALMKFILTIWFVALWVVLGIPIAFVKAIKATSTYIKEKKSEQNGI
ncbi:MAG: hypothetical protein IJQ66_03950 [Clostridia bacterium]|nr:hypothetical protein [Clostridia bacterium]